jgi:Phospholipase B
MKSSLLSLFFLSTSLGHIQDETTVQLSFSKIHGIIRDNAAPSAATASYTPGTLNSTGWAYLEITTNSSFTDGESAYAAGYLEGYLTFTEIYQFTVNAHGGLSPFSPVLRSWVENNTAYVKQQVTENPSDSFWYQVGLSMAQFQGLYDGYSAAAPASMQFSYEVLYAITMIGDLDDLCPALGCIDLPYGEFQCESKETCELEHENKLASKNFMRKRLHGNGHCSILVKPVGPVNRPLDIFFGHTTWNPYTTMLRIIKKYNFAFQQSASDSTIVAGDSILFSSYPGVLYSFDDWYTISSALSVAETTIINANPDLWSSVTYKSVQTWSRAMVSNRLASSGQLWVSLMSRENSGTYNNAWHIVDFKLFQSGDAIPDGFLYHLELFPGLIRSIDLSSILRAQTYWSSYNRPFSVDLFAESGQWALVDAHGLTFTWDLYSRPSIFRRLQTNVTDEASYVALMRHNNFETDPEGTQGCYNGVRSSVNAISSRGDLAPTTGCDEGTNTLLQNEGGIDFKYTSYNILTSAEHSKWLRFKAQSGPTTMQQPAFRWSTSPFSNYTHLGMTDLWDFPFVDFDV